MTSTAFPSLLLSTDLLASFDSLGHRETTPIQAQSLPLVLQGHDLIAQAKTNGGKTTAFSPALLSPLSPRYFDCQALVLCPTRELADQVAKGIRRLARTADNIKVLTLCGDVPYGPQVASLEHGAHMVVDTPGRIQEHLCRGTLVLDGLNTLVLDEADRMLSMGFYDSTAEIVSQLPEYRQTPLFSATYPDGIERLVETFMRDPRQVKVEPLHADGQIEQRFFEIDPKQRVDAMVCLLQHFRPQSCVTFCQTRQQCQELAGVLKVWRISTLALHGDLEQRECDQVLTVFANRSCNILVTTNVAARGLDITALETMTNVEPTRDPGIHIHRIGCSGHAGEKSLALSLMVPVGTSRAQAIENLQKQPLAWYALNQLKTSPEPLLPPMNTLYIVSGCKDKVRPGDLLGALTDDTGLSGNMVGKIAILDFQTFVAVERGLAHQALGRLSEDKIKGRSSKVRLLQRAVTSLTGPVPARNIVAG